jgi:hypothetical protein
MPSIENSSETPQSEPHALPEEQEEEEFLSHGEEADFLEDLLDFNFEGTTVKGGMQLQLFPPIQSIS